MNKKKLDYAFLSEHPQIQTSKTMKTVAKCDSAGGMIPLTESNKFTWQMKVTAFKEEMRSRKPATQIKLVSRMHTNKKFEDNHAEILVWQAEHRDNERNNS